jgi:formylglycine-generating enzyme required for sulfatase activity
MSTGAKVYRGGSWASPPTDVETFHRMHLLPNFDLIDLGFRCVKDAP